jgi:hypothetical protein
MLTGAEGQPALTPPLRFCDKFAYVEAKMFQNS